MTFEGYDEDVAELLKHFEEVRSRNHWSGMTLFEHVKQKVRSAEYSGRNNHKSRKVFALLLERLKQNYELNVYTEILKENKKCITS